ncbi:sulfatase-like hydrolase/transferase [Flavicella sp.]|uniref:sulfatase-like hydrolase/transferase n=1 Tax=Flavicella sp. TaxID=2957742 RepID=UPI002608451D|nr:sulfatase-like hydrolase/transferase [Flavicella sp.]MDG1805461.1 sulfatase-like hydrolase/transferase [Flavicella sp.]
MKNILFLLSLLPLAFSCSDSIVEQEEEEIIIVEEEEETESEPEIDSDHPNVLLIIADDMGMDASPYDTSFNGARTRKPVMPNVQKLYEDGIRFENAWVYPTCSPTRAAIITGKPSTQTGIETPGDHLTGSEKLLQAFINENTNDAYDTGVFGKWHLSTNSSVIEPMGIDTYKGTTSGGVSDYYVWTLEEDGFSTSITDYYTTTAYTDYAKEWISEREKPWFCWVAYNAAHTANEVFHTPKDAASYTTTGSNNLRMYMQMLEAMDYEIGNLLNSLDEATRANTIVIFVGDNGTPGKVAQAPFSGGNAKGSLHSGGVNTPFIVSGYGVDRIGISDKSLIEGTDLYATIADICGVENHDSEFSKSFKDLLSSDVGSNRTTNFSASANGYTLRDMNYKLTIENGIEYLSNLNSDYEETTNLLDSELEMEAQTSYDVLKSAYDQIK